MNRLLWITVTEAHLDHLADVMEDAWFEKLANAKADMLLLGSDTANARIFSRILGRIEEVFSGKVTLVAGNHDCYQTSIADFRSKLARIHSNGAIIFEPGCQSSVGGHFKMHHPWSLQSAPPWTRYF